MARVYCLSYVLLKLGASSGFCGNCGNFGCALVIRTPQPVARRAVPSSEVDEKSQEISRKFHEIGDGRIGEPTYRTVSKYL